MSLAGSVSEQFVEEVLIDLRSTLMRTSMSGAEGEPLHARVLVEDLTSRWLREGVASPLVQRARFAALVAGLLRNVLRSRRARLARRGEDVELRIVDWAARAAGHQQQVDFRALDLALVELDRMDERRARLAELHLLGGMDPELLAALFDGPPDILARELRVAMAWVRRTLSSVC